MKRFAIKAGVDIAWVVAIIFCSHVFNASILAFTTSIGSLLVVKWIADAVIAKKLPAKNRAVVGGTSSELPPTSPTPSQF